MKVKISVLVICVKTIIYLLLYNLHDCSFNFVNGIESAVCCANVTTQGVFMRKIMKKIHSTMQIYIGKKRNLSLKRFYLKRRF